MSVLEVGIAVPDTVEEFLALCGDSDGFTFVLWAGKTRLGASSVEIPEWPPKYKGHVIHASDVTFRAEASGKADAFDILRSEDSVLLSRGTLDQGRVRVYRGHLCTVTDIKIVGH